VATTRRTNDSRRRLHRFLQFLAPPLRVRQSGFGHTVVGAYHQFPTFGPRRTPFCYTPVLASPLFALFLPVHERHRLDMADVVRTVNFGGESGTLVMDLGTRSFRIGYALDNGPKMELPTVVGVLRDGAATDAGPLETGNSIHDNSKYFVDVTSMWVPRKGNLTVARYK